MNNKFYWTASVVVLIVLIGAGVYFVGLRKPSAVISPPVTVSTTTVYTNNQYGFSFTLPDDWQGYTTVTSTWNGTSSGACPLSGCPPITGPQILIRNPKWTAAENWQDIPIMIFTPSQWTEVLNGSLLVSAAPIPPTELGHNINYVFALPARYNYAFPTGWQEVDTIMQSNPLHAF